MRHQAAPTGGDGSRRRDLARGWSDGGMYGEKRLLTYAATTATLLRNG
jgi:hypothetical protein